MSNDRVTISLEAGVADVRLNRPDKMNAVDPAMWQGIAGALAELRATPGLRAVVLSGEGRAFCAGIDVGGLATRSGVGDLRTRSHGVANLAQHCAFGWRELPVPVIAAVHGVAFGAGFQIMLGADVRIATPDAQLSIMEMRWGLVPDVAGIALLRGLIRDDVARELIYTARRFSGEEGARLGAVTRVADDPLAEALALARTMAGQNPHAVRAAKRLLNAIPDGTTESLLMAESVEQEPLLASANHRGTLLAAREGRAPRFED